MTKVLMGVYVCRHVPSGKLYVGSSKNIARRIRYHIYQLEANQHHATRLQRAWNKYGADQFEWRLVETVDDLLFLHAREQMWLNRTRATDKRFGYNSHRDVQGPRGTKVSEATRLKLSMAQRGRKKSELHRQRIGLSNRGIKKRPRTEEERAKASAQFKGKKLPEERAARQRDILIERNKTLLAVPHTEEHNSSISAGLNKFYASPDSTVTRERLGAATRGKPWSEARRAAHPKHYNRKENDEHV